MEQRQLWGRLFLAALSRLGSWAPHPELTAAHPNPGDFRRQGPSVPGEGLHLEEPTNSLEEQTNELPLHPGRQKGLRGTSWNWIHCVGLCVAFLVTL